MAEGTEIYLGNGQHTNYSDEQWYFVMPPGTSHPFLEGRFQTDAPDRTGFLLWVETEFCVSCKGEVAVCRLPLKRILQPDEPNRFASVPDSVWKRAVEECNKLPSDPMGRR